MKRINIKKLFVRFLKEENLLTLTKYIVKGYNSTINEELITYAKNKTTINYTDCRFNNLIHHINDKSVTKGNKTRTPICLSTEWRNFLSAYCFRKDMETEFVKFMKKRGAYEKYIKNFSPEYARELKINWFPGLKTAYGAKWKTTDTINEWTDIVPAYYLKLGINLNSIKEESERKMWWNISKKWDEFLTNYTLKKEKDIVFYIK